MSKGSVKFCLGVAHIGDNPVEVASCVSETVLPSGQLPEIACGLGNGLVKELEDNSTIWLLVNSNFKLSESYFRHSGSSKEDVRRHWGCEVRSAQSSP